jgi:hypothetical protein
MEENIPEDFIGNKDFIKCFRKLYLDKNHGFTMLIDIFKKYF